MGQATAASLACCAADGAGLAVRFFRERSFHRLGGDACIVGPPAMVCVHHRHLAPGTPTRPFPGCVRGLWVKGPPGGNGTPGTAEGMRRSGHI